MNPYLFAEVCGLPAERYPPKGRRVAPRTRTGRPVEEDQRADDLPHASENLYQITGCAPRGKLAVFLDYDGTLTPIAEKKEDALLSADMREAIRQLSRYCTVVVITGRPIQDIRERIGLENIVYAGRHGREIDGPDGLHFEWGTEFLPLLDRAEERLKEDLFPFWGAKLIRNKFSILVDWSEMPEDQGDALEGLARAAAGDFPELHLEKGKQSIELTLKEEWDKGKALLWLMDALHLNAPDVLPLYFGDGIPDEDAFRSLSGQGIGILVERRTAAQYKLGHPEEVQQFMVELLRCMRGESDRPCFPRRI